MASTQLSPAPLPTDHPHARPGYGKRLAPAQSPRRADDFAQLPRREAAIAGYIDRLPEGADISVKTLAKQLADYGQCALRTALNDLSRAGHLRRHREAVIGANGQQRWVWRTFWSRAARDNSWWEAFTSGSDSPADTPADTLTDPAADRTDPVRPEEPEEPEEPEPPSLLARTAAYDVLARLGRIDPRLTLSEPECRALEEHAGLWFERGAGQAQLVQALTAGLPPVVAAPYGFVRARLLAKLPPAPAERPRPRRIMECTDCGVPAEPRQLPDGLCRVCRGVPADTKPFAPPGVVPPEHVRARVAELRTAMLRPATETGPEAGPEARAGTGTEAGAVRG
ncbi:hypothetical protein [Streptomyces sp. NPDC091212]|uniref:hypothetical protein n=1 Tax=Streptomyces sp. NPDC091212 TaxID=3155191 RepID=UPI00342AD3BB